MVHVFFEKWADDLDLDRDTPKIYSIVLCPKIQSFIDFSKNSSIDVLHCRNRDLAVSVLCSHDLDIDRMTCIRT